MSKADKNTQVGVASLALNIVLWILQVLLAALYLWHGWLFVAPQQSWLR